MKAVNGEREIGVLAMDAHVVPRQVVEPESARSGHLRLSGSEVDAHLERGRLQHHQAVVGASGCQEE